MKAIERSVKAVELTFNSVFTKNHDVRPIISSLPPDSSVRQSLLAAWNNPASFILHDYTPVMYSGLNNNTGNNNRKMKIGLIDFFRIGVLAIFPQ